MNYTFVSTEKNGEKAIIQECNTLFWLLKNHPKTDYFIVDAFNDVSAANVDFSTIIDTQCKNYKQMGPMLLGRSMVTLLSNYVSHFAFSEYILTVNKFNRSNLLNSNKSLFKMSNVKSDIVSDIKTGLIDEISKKVYTRDLGITMTQVNSFLAEVKVLIDNRAKSQVIDDSFNLPDRIKDDKTLLTSIYDDVRDVQSKLKLEDISDMLVSMPNQVLGFNRHIERGQVIQILTSRLVGNDLSSFNTPISFIEYKTSIGISVDKIKWITSDCFRQISKVFFTKSLTKRFFTVLFRLLEINECYKSYTLIDRFNEVEANILDKIDFLSKDSILYLLSVIEEDYVNEN